MNQVIDMTQDGVTVISESTDNQEMAISQYAQAVGVLATKLGYDGTLSVGALEDGIRFYQLRTAESCFEMGKRLLLLKEMTAHGEFSKRVEMLGFSKRMAQKFMSAVLKLSNANSSSLLQKAGTQTKLLELISLDDDEIQVIEEGGSIGEVNLDSIETMSVRELKQALRDAKADSQAKDNIIKKKDEKLNELDAELTKLQAPAQVKAKAESHKQTLAKSVLEKIQESTLTMHNDIVRFVNDCQAVAETIEENELYDLQEQFESNVVALFGQIAGISTTLGVQIDFENMVAPSWLNDIAQTNETQDND